MSTNASDYSEETLLHQTFDALWPITRSITGPGLEASLDLFKKHIPLVTEKVPSGSRVFDWTVPNEWHFTHAKLTGPDGKTICDSNKSNLHMVNYSEPVNKHLQLDELQHHIHSLPHLPTAIPYVTSYYKQNWGFCISHEKRLELLAGTYHAEIKSEFIEGGVPFAHHLLSGESDREILLTSYLCHPSLANNELSGPLVLLLLYKRISRWKKRRFSYRFLLNPETIGSLCFLSRYHGHLRDKLEAGMILTCVGGPSKNLRYKASQTGTSLFDSITEKIADHTISISDDLRTEPYSPLSGSDERQYGAPGFRLPVGQIARTVYGGFDAYHNSLDDKEFMDIKQLIKSTDAIEQMLLYAEVCGNPVNLSPFGEPQLGPRGLYPNISGTETSKNSTDRRLDGRVQLDAILTILSRADGHTSLFDIAEQCHCEIDDIIPIIHKLEAQQLIAYGRDAPTL